MRKFLRSTRRGWMIFNEADKGGPAGGGGGGEGGEKKGEAEVPGAPAPTPTPAPAPAPAPAEKTEAVAPGKLNVFQKAAGMLKDKAELLGIISGHEGTIAQLNAEKQTLNAQLSTLNAELAELKVGEAQIKAALEASEKKNTTVEGAAADKVASLGFDANKLPAASSAEGKDVPSSIEEFNKTHGELSQKDPTAASKFYTAHAWRFGLEKKPADQK